MRREAGEAGSLTRIIPLDCDCLPLSLFRITSHEDLDRPLGVYIQGLCVMNANGLKDRLKIVSSPGRYTMRIRLLNHFEFMIVTCPSSDLKYTI